MLVDVLWSVLRTWGNQEECTCIVRLLLTVCLENHLSPSGQFFSCDNLVI